MPASNGAFAPPRHELGEIFGRQAIGVGDAGGASHQGNIEAAHCAPLHVGVVERGADVNWLNSYGGNAVGTAIHGSANCFDTEGGGGMRIQEEAVTGDYPRIVEFLIERGSKLPPHIYGGSEAVQDVLRRHGVQDAE